MLTDLGYLAIGCFVLAIAGALLSEAMSKGPPTLE